MPVEQSSRFWLQSVTLAANPPQIAANLGEIIRLCVGETFAAARAMAALPDTRKNPTE
jgi:hypothetical protein